MNFGGRSMDNPINWSFGIGRVFGIQIRLHLLFILGAVFLLAPSMSEPEPGYVRLTLTERLLTVVILFAIVLLHEFGHCFGARRTGGSADEILLWPLGGLAMVAPAHNPRAHMITTAAGPAVNVLICMVIAVALTVLHGGVGAVPWNPFTPFSPIDSTVNYASQTQWWLRTVFGISYILLLFNLLPIYPFDGGRLLQTYLWPRRGYRQSVIIAAGTGMVGSIVVGVAGLISGEHMLIMIAVFGYVTCYYDRRMAKMEMEELSGEFGYDFSQGYTSLERSHVVTQRKPGFFEKRRAKKEEARRQREEQQRKQHERMVDAILTKIAKHGIDSLTSHERRILQLETDRKRSVDD